MRKLFAVAAVCAAGIAVASGPGLAQHSNPNVNLHKSMEADPLCMKYIQLVGLQASGAYKASPATAVAAYRSPCRDKFLECDMFWDAAKGKPNAAAGTFLADSLSHANWANRWRFKFASVDPGVGKRGALGVVLWKVPNAVDLVAATMSDQTKFQSLWAFRESNTIYPYWALWYLAATDKADLMIQHLEVEGAHRYIFLNLAHNFKLSPAQVEKIEAFCMKEIASSSRSNGETKRSCWRYLARIGSKNADLKEHLTTAASQPSTHEGLDALRAIGLLQHKGAKAQLSTILKKISGKKSVQVKTGKTFKSIKVDSWTGTNDAVTAAIALVGMGDAAAMKAINYWLSVGDRVFYDSYAFPMLLFETTLAHPAAQTKLSKPIQDTLKKIKPWIDGNDSTMTRNYNDGYVALLQMGDKAGLPRVLSVLAGAELEQIREVLRQLGGHDIPLQYQRLGTQGVRVGKGGLSPADATKILDVIRKRMTFWTDKTAKMYATRVIMDLEARIKLASR